MKHAVFGLALHIANLYSRLTPTTSGFASRRWLFRLAGADLAGDVRLWGRFTMDNRYVSIGPGTFVGAGSRFVGSPKARVTVGANCDVSTDVLLVTGSHEVGGPEHRAGAGYSSPITVGDGCWIGARVVVLGGVTIGAGSIVGAGSVVTKDVPPNSIVVGVPAKVLRSLDAASSA